MKKIYMLAVLVIAFTACTQDPQIIQLPTTTDTSAAVTDAAATAGDADAATRAADIPALVQASTEYTGYYALCVSPLGNLHCMYNKGSWDAPENNISEDWVTYTFYDLFGVFQLTRSACVDINEFSYFITPQNKLIKVSIDFDTESEQILIPSARVYGHSNYYGLDIKNITSSFPAGTVFLSLTAADNGNVFVTTGNSTDGDYGQTFPKHRVYRIAANGNATEIATVNTPVSATLIDGWSFFGDYSEWIDQIEYPSILSKAKGTVLYGLDADGDIYKVSTTNGTVEYFTPRVPIKCLGAALNGNNPYAISGNTIVEVRPTLAKDIVIGTIPADIAAAAYTLRVNADATAFYVGMTGGYVYKFTVE